MVFFNLGWALQKFDPCFNLNCNTDSTSSCFVCRQITGPSTEPDWCILSWKIPWIHHIPHYPTTPTKSTDVPNNTLPTPSNLLLTTLFLVVSHILAQQGTFTVPALSPAEWYCLNLSTPLIHTMPIKPPGANPNPDTTALPTKRRSWPYKVRTRKLAAKVSTSTSAPTDDHDSVLEPPAQSTDLVGQCWFMPHNDGKSDMDLVVMWCSILKTSANGAQEKNITPAKNSQYSLSTKVIPNEKASNVRRRWERMFHISSGDMVTCLCLIAFHSYIKKLEDWFKAAEAIQYATR